MGGGEHVFLDEASLMPCLRETAQHAVFLDANGLATPHLILDAPLVAVLPPPASPSLLGHLIYGWIYHTFLDDNIFVRTSMLRIILFTCTHAGFPGLYDTCMFLIQNDESNSGFKQCFS